MNFMNPEPQSQPYTSFAGQYHQFSGVVYQGAMKPKFGPWTYNPKNQTLTHTNGYYVDLETMTDSAQVLDWIAQVAEKRWANEADKDALDAGHLVIALNTLLRLQANYCGSGRGSTCNPKSVLKRQETRLSSSL